MTVELREQIGDTSAGGVLLLSADTTYNDADPIHIAKDIEIRGLQSAVVQSEFQLSGGATVMFNGFSMKGIVRSSVPAFNSFPSFPYPQNGQVVIRNAEFWYNDPDWTCEAGYGRQAIHCYRGLAEIRAKTRYSRINFSNSTERLMALLVGAEARLFGSDNDTIVLGLSSGSTQGRAIDIEHSKCVMSGVNMVRPAGSTDLAVSVARGGSLQIGAGLWVGIDYPTPAMIDGEEARKIHTDGSRSSLSSNASHLWIAPGLLPGWVW